MSRRCKSQTALDCDREEGHQGTHHCNAAIWVAERPTFRGRAEPIESPPIQCEHRANPAVGYLIRNTVDEASPALQTLRELAHRDGDAIAHAIAQSIANGRPESETIPEALRFYSAEVAQLRARLIAYMDVSSRPPPYIVIDPAKLGVRDDSTTPLCPMCRVETREIATMGRHRRYECPRCLLTNPVPE